MTDWIYTSEQWVLRHIVYSDYIRVYVCVYMYVYAYMCEYISTNICYYLLEKCLAWDFYIASFAPFPFGPVDIVLIILK